MSNGKKSKQDVGGHTLGPKAEMEAEHTRKLSGRQITIFGILVMIFLGVFCPIILILPLPSIIINISILIGFLVVAFRTWWWKRYTCWDYIKRLEERLGGSKTYR